MALVKCPECNQLISDKAALCPKCGYPIQDHLRENADGDNVQKGLEENLSADEDVSQKENGSELDPHFEMKSYDKDGQSTAPRGGKKKAIVIALTACLIFAVVLCATFVIRASNKFHVKDISIEKWVLADSTDYSDMYRGAVTSDQKSPFIAVIENNTEDSHLFSYVFMDGGTGTIETYIDEDEDPSKEFRPIGYFYGSQMDSSEIKVEYTDTKYYDYKFLDETSCHITGSIDIGNSRNGILFFDIIDETKSKTSSNHITSIVDGKGEFFYFLDIPYKSRGVDITIEPKMFCESETVSAQDYTVKVPFSAKKETDVYIQNYSGEEVLSFDGYQDGIVVYTKELKGGGDKEDWDIAIGSFTPLRNEECTLSTYDSATLDEKLLEPKYEFNIVGYIKLGKIED